MSTTMSTTWSGGARSRRGGHHGEEKEGARSGTDRDGIRREKMSHSEEAHGQFRSEDSSRNREEK